MAFVDEFDGTLPLEDQLAFPLFYGGLEMIAEENGSRNNFLVLSADQAVHLSPLESTYLALLMVDGYVSRKELFLPGDAGETGDANVSSRMRELRKKVRAGQIKTRWSSGPYHKGGFYFGELKSHRRERSNIAAYNGLTCNAVTGYVELPNGGEAYLTPLHTEMAAVVLGQEKGIASKDLLHYELYSRHGITGISREVLDAHLYQLNKALGGKYFKATGSGEIAFAH